MKAYELIREKDKKRIFEAAYVKHYFGGQYCALLEDYPTADTRVLLCKKVQETDKSYGYLLCYLEGHDISGERKIGFYVTVGEVGSEQEAEVKLKAILSGNARINKIVK